jgi:hypothetical protein
VSPERRNPTSSVWRTKSVGQDNAHRLERCVIPARAFIIRFPNGDFEYDFSRLAAPQPGEILRRQGVLWSVVQVKDDVVKEIHVARAPEENATGTAQQNDPWP